MKCINCGAESRKMFDCDSYAYFRCISCKHVTTLPFPDSIQLKAHYESGFNEGNYRVAIEHSEDYCSAMSQIIGVIDKYIRRNNLSLAEMSILDVGCFTGEFIYLLSELGADVWGIEFQPEAAAIAEEKLPGKIINIDVMDEKLPFLEGQFDMITLLGVLEHVVDPYKLLNRAKQLLKEDGILVVQTPNSMSFLARIMGRLWPSYTPVEHIHVFSRQSLFMVLKNLGFRNVIYMPHWKRLSVSYVYRMLKIFGPVFHKGISVVWRIVPGPIKRARLPFYGGEMIVIADSNANYPS